MNLHEIQPTQTRYTIRPVTDVDQYDICEWDTFAMGDVCGNQMSQALVDTSIPTGIAYHGIKGACVGHLCTEHIGPAYEATINPV